MRRGRERAPVGALRASRLPPQRSDWTESLGLARTNNPLRREGEVGIQLPEKFQPVHYIKTDDPAGVENYWHTRFASKRKEGEWFALSAQDVRAFKRWRRIY